MNLGLDGRKKAANILKAVGPDPPPKNGCLKADLEVPATPTPGGLATYLPCQGLDGLAEVAGGCQRACARTSRIPAARCAEVHILRSDGLMPLPVPCFAALGDTPARTPRWQKFKWSPCAAVPKRQAQVFPGVQSGRSLLDPS